jgi:hypothetical protein
MGFYADYKAVFDAVKAALVYVPAVGETPASGVASIKTVVLGEQFSLGALPKAIINAEPSPVKPLEMGSVLDVRVNFSVVLVILEYEPKDWFVDIISVMGDVVDAVLADRTLGGAAKDVFPVGFAPGEITFKDKLFFGGRVLFQAEVWHEP